MTNSSRVPRGVTTGGQFAPQTHTEVEINLTPVDLSKVDIMCHACGQMVAGSDYPDHDQGCTDNSSGDETPFVYPGTVGADLTAQLAAETVLAGANGTNPFSDSSDPSWSSLTVEFGEHHASELFDRYNGNLDQATTIGAIEWDPVSLDPEVCQRLATKGVTPGDFTSDDRSRRMWAHVSRGDLVFEDELVSEAFDLSRHGLPVQDNVVRVLGAPQTVPLEDTSERWSDLPPGEQLSYIDGYAAGATAVRDARFRETSISGSDDRAVSWDRFRLRDRGPGAHAEDSDRGRAARIAGFHRAVNAAHFEDDVTEGRVTPDQQFEVSWGDAVGGTAVVSGIEKIDLSGYNDFRGVVAAGQRRWSETGETVDWREGAPVRFGLDSVLGPKS